MSETAKTPERTKTPVAVITSVPRGSKYPTNSLPDVNLNILFSLEALEKLIAEAREKGTAQLQWNVRQPKLRIVFETWDKSKSSVQKTAYFQVAEQGAEDRDLLHITTL